MRVNVHIHCSTSGVAVLRALTRQIKTFSQTKAQPLETFHPSPRIFFHRPSSNCRNTLPCWYVCSRGWLCVSLCNRSEEFSAGQIDGHILQHCGGKRRSIGQYSVSDFLACLTEPAGSDHIWWSDRLSQVQMPCELPVYFWDCQTAAVWYRAILVRLRVMF